jgi:hypothetical protein
VVDLVIRCIEDEVSQTVATQQEDPLLIVDYLNLMSTYWIGGMYETLRLLRERKLTGDDGRFFEIFTDLELLRIPLEKHELAKGNALKEPLILIRNPPKGYGDIFPYVRGDPRRSHIMPMGISPRGSIMWQAIDVRARTAKWIERRTLSDQLLRLWVSENSATLRSQSPTRTKAGVGGC